MHRFSQTAVVVSLKGVIDDGGSVKMLSRIDLTGLSPALFDRVGNVGVSAPTADRQTQAAPVLESGIAT